ncbi:MAG: response regulator, partial [Victivallales bacterium]|nr:response regulator [Victivallales bacterium]
EGTVFRIHLPVAEETRLAKTTMESGNVQHLGGKILVIDDEEVIRTVLERVLNEFGYETLLASNGKEGVALFKEHFREIKLVILDMLMPVMNGDECFMQLKTIDPGVKVIVASGFASDTAFARMKREGANGFLRKPFKNEDLSNLISKTLKEL